MALEIGLCDPHNHDRNDDDHDHDHDDHDDDHDDNNSCLGISRGERTAYHAEGRRTVFGED